VIVSVGTQSLLLSWCIPDCLCSCYRPRPEQRLWCECARVRRCRSDDGARLTIRWSENQVSTRYTLEELTALTCHLPKLKAPESGLHGHGGPLTQSGSATNTLWRGSDAPRLRSRACCALRGPALLFCGLGHSSQTPSSSKLRSSRPEIVHGQHQPRDTHPNATMSLLSSSSRTPTTRLLTSTSSSIHTRPPCNPHPPPTPPLHLHPTRHALGWFLVPTSHDIARTNIQKPERYAQHAALESLESEADERRGRRRRTVARVQS
jgi:hypothetical protein